MTRHTHIKSHFFLDQEPQAPLFHLYKVSRFQRKTLETKEIRTLKDSNADAEADQSVLQKA